MKMPRLARLLPSWENALLAAVAAVLLILAFPDLEYWFLAWFAIVPLMWAVELEKVSILRSLFMASIGGVYLIGFVVVLFNAFLFWSNLRLISSGHRYPLYGAIAIFWIAFGLFISYFGDFGEGLSTTPKPGSATIVAIQPNVPMSR